MLFIFSVPVLIRHVWQHKGVVFLHWCLMCAVLLSIGLKLPKTIDIFIGRLLNGLSLIHRTLWILRNSLNYMISNIVFFLLKAQAVRVQAAQVLFMTASFPFVEVEFLVW